VTRKRLRMRSTTVEARVPEVIGDADAASVIEIAEDVGAAAPGVMNGKDHERQSDCRRWTALLMRITSIRRQHSRFEP